MSETDNEIDLDSINKPIYKDAIELMNFDSIEGDDLVARYNNCFDRDSNDKNKKNFMIQNDFDYKKFFVIRSNRRLEPDTDQLDYSSIIDVSEPYIRTNNNQDIEGLNGDFKEIWRNNLNDEVNLFIDSIIACTIIKHKFQYQKTHNLIECNKVLENIGCYCIYPFIELNTSTEDDATTSTTYKISLPKILKLPTQDILNNNNYAEKEDICPMFNVDDNNDKNDLQFLESIDISIDDQITYQTMKDKIKQSYFIKNILYTDEMDNKKYNELGVNFADGINNLIEHNIYKEFINMYENYSNNENKFSKYLIEPPSTDADPNNGSTANEIYVGQTGLTDSTTISTNNKYLFPIHIIPKPSSSKINELQKSIQKHVQEQIDDIYSKIPKVHKTYTKLVYKKMIINSIYFTSETYRKDNSQSPSITDKTGNRIKNNLWTKYSYKDDLYADVSNNKNIVGLNQQEISEDNGDKFLHYHFVIDVAFPICNTNPIRSGLTDVLLSNNLIVIILSYLTGIILHALVSCCLEFWLQYGSGTECIYITNTCKNIGNIKDHHISLIEYYFRYRLNNFPYQHCMANIIQSGGNIRKFNYPSFGTDETRKCIPEDSRSMYDNKRPFPYNIVDYAEKNFDAESIKYLFRIIFIFILCFLLPFRFLFNKSLDKLSYFYNKYIIKSKLISSILFILLPLTIPFMAILIVLSLGLSLLLFFLYSLLSIVHVISAMIVPAYYYNDSVWAKITGLLGSISGFGVLCLLIMLIYESAIKTKDHSEWYKLSVFWKFIIIIVGITSTFILFLIKNVIEIKDPMLNEIGFNKKFDRFYKILFEIFDYENLQSKQKNELKNNRIENEVYREDGNRKSKPLYEWLATKSSKISVFMFKVILLVVTVTSYFFNNDDKYNKTFLKIISVLVSLLVYSILTNGLNAFFVHSAEKQYRFVSPEVEVCTKTFLSRFCGKKDEFPYKLAVFLKGLAWFFMGGLIASMTVWSSIEGGNRFEEEFETINRDKQNKTENPANSEGGIKVYNKLNIATKNSLDIAEFIIFLKKIVYLLCLSIVMFFTVLLLPFILVILTIFIFLEILYIFIIVPFTKGGHFFFRIMKNRYKILTYLLCIGVIANIKQREMFGTNNTNIVVYTMSGILGFIMIYNFVNE
tara:strand:- start:71 stop:3499 length:3429 start_codon:yes stop_codon:yes gene_type:complete